MFDKIYLKLECHASNGIQKSWFLLFLKCLRCEFGFSANFWVTSNIKCDMRVTLHTGSYVLDNQISVPRAGTKMKNYWAPATARSGAHLPTACACICFPPFWTNRTPRRHNIGFHLFREKWTSTRRHPTFICFRATVPGAHGCLRRHKILHTAFPLQQQPYRYSSLGYNKAKCVLIKIKNVSFIFWFSAL